MHNKRIELKLSSDIQLEDLKNYNIIYIGPYKCLHILKTITRNLHFTYIQQPRILKFFREDSNKVITYLFEESDLRTQLRVDYAMVVKVSGKHNNEFILFMSNHDFGNLSTVKKFTNLDFLENLRNQLASNYFEALFEVKGITIRDFDSKLLHINTLRSDFRL